MYPYNYNVLPAQQILQANGKSSIDMMYVEKAAWIKQMLQL